MTRLINSLSLPSIITLIKNSFESIPDVRNKDAHAYQYKQTDVLMTGLAMMFAQEPSMAEFQRNLQLKKNINNLKTIFRVSKIPEVTQIREIIDGVSPDHIQTAFFACQKQFQKTNQWKKYRVLGGRYAVLIDAVDFYHSNTFHCNHCLKTKHRNGTVDYYHKALVTTLSHPDVKIPIPFQSEEIRLEDGYIKQDCEINASKRLIPKLAKQHPKLDMIIVGDGLYSKSPMIQVIKEAGLSYILVAKPTQTFSLKFVFLSKILFLFQRIPGLFDTFYR